MHVPQMKENEGKNAAPEKGAPEHVQQNFAAFGAQNRGQNSADDGTEQNGRKKCNAAHSELLPDFYNAPAFFVEDRFSLKAAVFGVIFRNGRANYTEK